MNDDDDDMGEDSDQTDDMAEVPSQNEMKLYKFYFYHHYLVIHSHLLN